MFLREFMDNFDIPFSRYENEDDQSPLKRNDTRKTRLTLRQIHILRQMNDIQTFEKAKEIDKVQKIYMTPTEQPAL